MIVSDDQGSDDYGFLGHPHIRTPHLDRLASQSLTFRHAYVTSSLCRPSLATILTGLYPHQHRITSNDPPLPKGKPGREANRDPTFLAQRQKMIDNIDRVATRAAVVAKLGLRQLSDRQMVGRELQTRRIHRRHVAGRAARRPRPGDRPGNDAAGLRFHPSRRGREETVFRVVCADAAAQSPQSAAAIAGSLSQPGADRRRLPNIGRWSSGSTKPAANCSRISTSSIWRTTRVVVYITDNGWIQDPTEGSLCAAFEAIAIQWRLADAADAALARPHRSMDDRFARQQYRPGTDHAFDRRFETSGRDDRREPARSSSHRRPSGDLRRDFHAQRRRHRAAGDEPAVSLVHRREHEVDRSATRERASTVVELYDLATDPGEKHNLATEQPDEVARLRN